MATDVGTLVMIEVNGKLLIGQSSMSYARASTMIEVSSKTTGKHAKFKAGRISSNMGTGGIASSSKEATKAGYWELWDHQEDGTEWPVTLTEYSDETGGTPVVGAEKITQNALVSNLAWEAPDNDKMTFSCDIQLTGEPTRSTNAGA